MEEILSALDNDIIDELDALKNIHDWALISNLMAGKKYISEARLALYEKHHQDLQLLKKTYHTWCRRNMTICSGIWKKTITVPMPICQCQRLQDPERRQMYPGRSLQTD